MADYALACLQHQQRQITVLEVGPFLDTRAVNGTITHILVRFLGER